MKISSITKNIARLILGLAVILATFGSLPEKAQAAPTDPVDLQLGDTGAVAWVIYNIKPGDGGTKAVELHNSGTNDGLVTIWFSDIISGEGLNPAAETGNKAEPGELDKYLTLNLTGSKVVSTLSLPSVFDKLPQSYADSNSIEVAPVKAGQTVNIVWHWALPPGVGNDVQGDALSFKINYTLREISVTNVAPYVDVPTKTFISDVVIPDDITTSKIIIDVSTQGAKLDGNALSEIWFVRLSKEPVTVEPGEETIGPQWEAGPHGTVFDRPITIVLSYNPATLPVGFDEDNINISTWDETLGKWVELPTVVDKVNKKVTTQVTHFSRYTIIVPVTGGGGGGGGGGGSGGSSVTPEAGTPQVVDPQPQPQLPTLEAVIMGDERVTQVAVDGSLLQPLYLTDPDAVFRIEFMRGSRITDAAGTPATRIEITRVRDPPGGVPQDVQLLSPVYRVIGYIGNYRLPRVYFHPYSTLKILYDPKDLKPDSPQPYIINYTEGEGWNYLPAPSGGFLDIGKAQANISHASLFAAAVNVPQIIPPLPPNFKVMDLKITPAAAYLGSPVTVNVTIANEGDTGGTYEMFLVIDGIIRATRSLTLQAHSLQIVSFEVADVSVGKHEVRVAGVRGDFQIVSVEEPLPPESGFWLFVTDIGIALLIIVVLISIYIIIKRSTKRKKDEEEPSGYFGGLRRRNRKDEDDHGS